MDFDDLVLVIVLAAVAVLVLLFFAAKEFQRIAKMKGYYEKRYFWWCFLFSAVGMLMVVALPDRADKAEASHAPNDELPDL